jgi:hypothetical protein
MLAALLLLRRLYGELLQRDRKLLRTQQLLQQLRGSVHGLLSGLQVRVLACILARKQQ